MSSEPFEPTSPPVHLDDDHVEAIEPDVTDVPPVAELDLAFGSKRAVDRRREAGLIPMMALSVLAHAAAVFGAWTIYAMYGRAPEVTISTGTGAAAAFGSVVSHDLA